MPAYRCRQRREAPLVEFSSRDDFEKWLDGKPREVAIALAARAALRVLPIVQEATREGYAGDFYKSIVLPVFRAVSISWVAAKYPARKSERSFAAAAAEFATETVEAATFAVRPVASAASYAAMCVAVTTTTKVSSIAARSAAAAIDAAALTARSAGARLCWAALSIDATRIDAGETISVITAAPIWPQERPDLLRLLWIELYVGFQRANSDWQVWTAWYEDRLAGRVRDEDRELAYVLLGDDLWKQGPAAVNAEIMRRIDANAIDGASNPRPWVNTLAAIPESPLGNKWTERGDRLEIDPRGNDTDDAAALDPVVCQLHEAVRRKAIAFAKSMAGIEEQLGWTGVEGAIERFRAVVDVDTLEIPSRIATVYDATIEFASFLALDNDLRKRFQGNVTPLNPIARREFEDLVRTAAPWIRRFPTACALDDHTGAFLLRPDLFEPAIAVVDGAGQAAVISTEDRDRIRALLSAVERGGFPAEKAGTRGVLSIRNLIVVALTTAVAGCTGFYSGAVSSDFANRSELVKKIGTFLAAEESHVLRILGDGTTDLRLALSSLLAELQQGDNGDKSSTHNGDRYVIVDRRRDEEDTH